MDDGLKMKVLCFTIDCKDAHELAKFYAALLKWEIGFVDEEYAWVYAPGTEPGTYPYLLFQQDSEYLPPVWPEASAAQQQMAHLDIAVNDLEKAMRHALDCGATVANEQFSDQWRVIIDPSGHPFCLCPRKELFTMDE